MTRLFESTLRTVALSFVLLAVGAVGCLYNEDNLRALKGGAGGAQAGGGPGGLCAAGGSGGTPVTGETIQVTCSPACTAEQDCIKEACVPSPWYGMTCNTTEDCPSNTTCCDGSNEISDGTRVPAGDKAEPGEFVLSPDGLMVTDTITGLVWQRHGSGLREGCRDKPYCTWSEAKAYCAGLVLGGTSGWRLPGRKELHTIVDFTRLYPAIDPNAFPQTPSGNFWTSSPDARNPGDMWLVDFGDGGSISFPTGSAYGDTEARCVR